MDKTLMQVFDVAVWFFAFFGFIVTFALAFIGFKMVSLAIGFSVQYSYSEYQQRKLKNASEATKAKLAPTLEDFDKGEDEEEKKPKKA